jgi:hypothetical protein
MNVYQIFPYRWGAHGSYEVRRYTGRGYTVLVADVDLRTAKRLIKSKARRAS